MGNHVDVIVVGGGPAGLICAGRAAQRGRRVLLLERSNKPALKLGITGKGRCNLTNNCDRDAFLAAVKTNGRFLYSAFSAFSPQDVIRFFEGLGVPLKTERGGRVFPASDKAGEIVRALVGYARASGVKIKQERATRLLIEDGKIAGVAGQSGQEYRADSVVIATGGLSYPRTGSAGDGYILAEQAGHTIIPTRASLVPIVTREKWPAKAMGLSLKNVTLSLRRQGDARPVFEEMGEMLFAHFGVSGPLVLSASAHITGEASDYFLFIDLKPALTHQQLDARILRDFSKQQNRDFGNSLGGLLPAGLVSPVVLLSGISPTVKVHQVTRQERGRLVDLLKGLTLRVRELRPVEEAVVTAGGVCVKGVHPGRMESRVVSGLYFAGEVLDLDAYTGGFNLQIAFCTGWVVGESI